MGDIDKLVDWPLLMDERRVDHPDHHNFSHDKLGCLRRDSAEGPVGNVWPCANPYFRHPVNL